MNINGMVTALILLIVGIIIVFQIIGNTANDLKNASANISTSGLPLANLFSSNGVVMLVFMAGVLIAIVVVALKMGKK